MDAPLRVAIVAPSMRILGGQAVQAARLLAAWHDDPDVSAWLVPINPPPPRGLRWLLRVRYLRTVVTQLLYWPLLVREIRKADVVHVFSASYFSFLLAPLPAVLVARLLKRPVILNYRSGEAPDHLRRSRIARATLRRVNVVLVPSRFLRDVFASFGLAARVIPNIVDVDRFAFRLREPVRARLLSTRNFEGLYNVECTLRAFRLVQDECPDAALTLVGSGSREASLRQLVGELGLRNVTFAGRVAPEDIWRYYADADLYVQTPDIDNMPSSILEAFSSGTPVVSTDAGGVPAIVESDVNGLLAPAGDARAVAAQVLRLLGDPGLASRIAEAARASCEHYTWTRVRRQWVELYDELADQRRPKGASGSPARVNRPRSVLARVRAMDRHELAFRARTAAIRIERRVEAMAGRNRWRRRDLAAVLASDDSAMSAVRERLRAGDWMAAHEALAARFRRRPARFVLDPRSRAAIVSTIDSRFPQATGEARARADRILGGRYDLLGYADLRFDANSGLDWKLDPAHGRHAPDAWWSAVKYLDPANGDHKIIWEFNRHQHWLTLGRAYWLTGRREYRDRFVAELESWLAQNRPLVGINWASMLELGLRGLSWIWALHFFVEEGTGDTTPWLVDLLLGLDRQMRHVEENLSHYFSPNTHLTGEALALYVVGRVLPEMRGSAAWEATGRRVLIEQAERQIAPDGGHAERSTHYHRYTLDFYLLALAVARKTGDTAAERAFEPVVARLARFAWALADATGFLPRIGDDDAGALMPLSDTAAENVRPSLSIAASLVPGEVPAVELAEEALWVAGPDASLPGGARVVSQMVEWNRSAAFPATGYYVSRSRTADHLVFDAGPHGFLNGGHAHADALSVTLTLRWHRLLVDAGTGTYTMDPEVRDRFRSTALHNTVTVDGRPQSQPDGPFHWAAAANALPVRSALNPRFDFFEASHDGYSPLTHRRAVFCAGGDLWLVVDHLLGEGEHTADAHWHLAPDWDVRIESPIIEATHADGVRAVLATTANQVDVFRGDDATGLGWCSPAYGRIVPCPAIRFSRSARAPFSVATLIVPSHEAAYVSMNAVPVAGGPPGSHAFAVRIARPGAIDLALFGVRSESGQNPPPLGVRSESGQNPPPLGVRSESGDALRSSRPDPQGWWKSTSSRPDPGWRFGGFETDARFAFVRLSPTGAVRAVSLLDGRVLQRVTDDPFRLELDRAAGDLALTLDDSGLLEIFSSERLPTLAVDAPTSIINRVRIDDLAASFQRRATGVVVPAEQEMRGREIRLKPDPTAAAADQHRGRGVRLQADLKS